MMIDVYVETQYNPLTVTLTNHQKVHSLQLCKTSSTPLTVN